MIHEIGFKQQIDGYGEGTSDAALNFEHITDTNGESMGICSCSSVKKLALPEAVIMLTSELLTFIALDVSDLNS